MKIESKRFGTMEVKEDRILTLRGGLLGFTELNRFLLVDDQEDPTLPFKWLISVEDPEYGFLVTDPGIFFRDYIFELSSEDQKELDVRKEDDITVLTLLTIPSDPRKITTNLRGPLVFNSKTLVGKQVILGDGGYATKHFIYLGAKEEGEEEADAESAISETADATASAIKASSNANTDVVRQS